MLQINFTMIYIILKISVLVKITRILKRFLRSIIDNNMSQKEKTTPKYFCGKIFRESLFTFSSNNKYS